jgi:hypothetical protein
MRTVVIENVGDEITLNFLKWWELGAWDYFKKKNEWTSNFNERVGLDANKICAQFLLSDKFARYETALFYKMLE